MNAERYVVFTNYLPVAGDHGILITDKDFNVIEKYLYLDGRLLGLAFSNTTRMLPQGNHLLLSQPFSYDIHSISIDGVDIKYMIDFPGYAIDNHTFDLLKEKGTPFEKIQSQKVFLETLNSGNSCWFIENFYESEKIIGFQFTFQKKKHLFLRSKKRNEDIVISKMFLDDGSNFNGYLHCFDNNKLIASVESDRDTEGLKVMIIDLTNY